MKVEAKETKVSIEKQIILLFVITSLLMILLGFLNYTSVENYENSIQSIRHKTIEQLSLISIIGLNSGNSELYVLHHLYATQPERKNFYDNKINSLIKESDSLYNELEGLIVKGITRDSLQQVLYARNLYIAEVRKAVEISNKEKDAVPFEYEEKIIRPVFENYRQKLDDFSYLVIQNAEADLASTVAKVNKTKGFTKIVIVFGIIVILISSLFILKIYKRLTQNYLQLRKETDERKKAQKELQLLNEQLEAKVKERTAALEEAYKDISNYNDKLKELSLTKDKFISVISHDLRNPLSVIITSSDFLIKGMGKIRELNDEVKQFASVINRASNKVINQLNELVERAKLKDPNRIFEPVKLNLMEIVTQSIQLLESSAKQKKIVLKNEISPSDYVNADKFMLRSIIQNLESNAIKFTPEGGTVTIKAVRKNGMEEIRVTDTGTGMRAEEIERIFKEGAAFSTPGTAMEKGAGFGLILVKDFVDKLGGTISVESEPGKGCSFIFTVPCVN